MLTLVGWISGLSATGVVIFSVIMGLFVMYKSRKINANLLFCMGFMLIFAGLCWSAGFIDIVTILLTGRNMDNSYGLFGIWAYMWIPPMFVTAIYISADIMIPKKKWYIVAIYVVLGVVFEFFLFLDPFGSCIFVYPETPGENIIDVIIVLESPAGIIFLIFILTFTIFWVLGFLYEGLKAIGVARKKFLILSIGSFLWLVFAVLDVLIPPGILEIIVRSGVLCSQWLMYLGFVRQLRVKKESS